ncbi:hypothetical protein [Psychrobacter lutiphocae]|nr:hypothetical protein [Psychrobacter lutiphocae]
MCCLLLREPAHRKRLQRVLPASISASIEAKPHPTTTFKAFAGYRM